MWPSLKPTQRTTLAAVADPQSIDGVVHTAFVDASLFANLLAIVAVGALGAGAAVDAKLEQALDAAGAGLKDVAGKAIATINAVGSVQAEIDCRADEVDVQNDYRFVRLTINASVAASAVTGALLGFDPHYAPLDPAASVQVVA